jgi:hypothetical protein
MILSAPTPLAASVCLRPKRHPDSNRRPTRYDGEVHRAALALLLLLPACRDWRERVDPARAAAEPVQEPTTDDPFDIERKGHRIRLVPRAHYSITGYVVETSRELLDQWDFVMPLDVALVWGPVADPAVLRRLRFHLSQRYVSYRYVAPIAQAPEPVLISHISNNHILPADEAVAGELARVRIGDLLTLSGRLVDVEIYDPSGREVARMRTSLTRTDVGSGACEIIYVERVERERP